MNPENYHHKLDIKSWAEEDRPREKLLLKGKKALSDAELIAILIGSGSRNETAVDLSKRILKSVNNNLHQLAKLSVKDLMKFKGIGEAKAISIVAALEIGGRRQMANILQKPQITCSKDIFDLFQPLIGDLPHEEFWVLLLNRHNKIEEKVQISQGGVAGTVADTKIIFKKAIQCLASSIILLHNHPSGNLQPSNADKSITKKMVEAGKLLEIAVLDHLIITQGGYFSFADEGLI